ncbi:hypothetical protein ACFO3O_01110 [Dokdonia ponticola]|uniref:Uncharacterized protein n=1 Tax=Dokdonia ponticola TaxID=2041041 RepID=A0ABV9HQM4_9FLAO
MNKNSRNPMITLFFAIIIGVFSIITAIVQYNEKIKEKKQAEIQEAEAKDYRLRFEASQKKLLELQEENKTYTVKNIELSNESLKLQEENKTLTVKNIELSNESLRYNTSYGSYPIIVISGYQSRAFKGRNTEETIDFKILDFNVINSGEYPLKNVKLKFNDVYGKLIGQYVTVGKSSISQEPDKRFKTIDPARELSIGSIPKHEVLRELYFTTLPMNFEGTYEVEVVWDSGYISYLIDVVNKEEDLSFIYSQIYAPDIKTKKDDILNLITENFTLNKYTIK